MSVSLISLGYDAGTALFFIALALPLIYLIGQRLLSIHLSKLGVLLTRVAGAIDAANNVFGRIVSWFALGMVLVQTIVVIQRYVFGVNSIWLQESVMYMYGLLFLLAAGYTLLHGGHVRVDIFYREASSRAKALVDLMGTYLFLFPVMCLILVIGYPYAEMSWRIGEGSAETSGIQGIYILKGAILAFAGFMILQGYSLAIRSVFVLAGQAPVTPDADEPASIL